MALLKIPPKHTIDSQLRSSDAFKVSYLSNFMSTILMLPVILLLAINCSHSLYYVNKNLVLLLQDRQNGNYLAMFKAMLKVILNHLSWECTTPSRYTLLLKCIDLLANMAQEDFLYHAGECKRNHFRK